MSHKHICFALLLMPALKCCATVCGQFANFPFPYSPSNVVILLALTVSLTNLMQILHSLLNIFVVSIFSLYSVLFSIRFFFLFFAISSVFVFVWVLVIFHARDLYKIYSCCWQSCLHFVTQLIVPDLFMPNYLVLVLSCQIERPKIMKNDIKMWWNKNLILVWLLNFMFAGNCLQAKFTTIARLSCKLIKRLKLCKTKFILLNFVFSKFLF